MDTILLPLLPLLAVLAFVLFHQSRRVACPDCGALLPVLYSPFKKTRRMWRAGGYLCAQCGCETNMAGRKVTADTPFPPFPTLHWALLGIALLAGFGLAASIMLIRPAVVVPPMVALPQQAPAATSVK